MQKKYILRVITFSFYFFLSLIFASCDSIALTVNAMHVIEIKKSGALRHHYVAVQIMDPINEYKNYKLALLEMEKTPPTIADMRNPANKGIVTRNIPSNAPINLIMARPMESDILFSGTKAIIQNKDGTIDGLLEPGKQYILYGLADTIDAKVVAHKVLSTSPYNAYDFVGSKESHFLDPSLDDTYFTIRPEEPIFVPSAFKISAGEPLTKKYETIYPIPVHSEFKQSEDLSFASSSQQQSSSLSTTWNVPKGQLVELLWSLNDKDQNKVTYTQLLGTTPFSADIRPSNVISISQDNDARSTDVHLGFTLAQPPQTINQSQIKYSITTTIKQGTGEQLEEKSSEWRARSRTIHFVFEGQAFP